MKFSVLLSVYINDKAQYVKECLDSIIYQTLKPNEIVLVIDGPIKDELKNLITEYKNKHSELLKIVKLEKNVGTALALNRGVLECKYDAIAKMDADDICEQDRFEKQITILKMNPDIDLVGSYIAEFEDHKNNVITVRKVPIDHDSIYKYAKWRNPINHMTAMYRKQAVLNVGNYMSFSGITVYHEDYYLWIRMLINGSKMMNIPECLVKFRAGADMYKRRKKMNEIAFQNELIRLRFISIFEFIRNIILKEILRSTPTSFKRFLYMNLLRIRI